MSEPLFTDAEKIIEAFGGIRPMAKKLGVAVTTVQGWKERNAIPVARHAEVRAAAEREGIDLRAGAAPEPARSPEDGAGPPTAATDATAPDTTADDAATGSPDGETGAADPAAGDASDPARPRTGAPRGERVRTARTEKVADRPDAGVRASEAATDGPPVIDQPAADGRGGSRKGSSGHQAGGRGAGRPILTGAGFAVALLVGAAAMWYFGPRLPVPAPDTRPDAAPDTAALERRLDSAEADVKRLREELAAQERTLGEATGAAAGLAQRLEDAEKALAAAEKKLAEGAGGAADPDRDGLRSRVDDVAKALEALAERVDALPATRVDAAAVERLSGEIGAAAGRLQAIENRLKDLDMPDIAAQTGATAAAVEALEARNAELKSALDAANGRIEALDRRLAALGTADARRSALLVALGQLRQDAVAGRPYAAALDAVRGLAREADAPPAVAEALDRLAPAAGSGVPTVAALRAEFDPVTVDITRAATLPDDPDWSDRVWSRLRGLVTVRRTGRTVAGDTPEALIARAETALAEERLAEAVALVEKLPEQARAPAEPWLGRAKTRLAVDEAVAALGRASAELLRGPAPDNDERVPDAAPDTAPGPAPDTPDKP